MFTPTRLKFIFAALAIIALTDVIRERAVAPAAMSWIDHRLTGKRAVRTMLAHSSLSLAVTNG